MSQSRNFVLIARYSRNWKGYFILPWKHFTEESYGSTNASSTSFTLYEFTLAEDLILQI